MEKDLDRENCEGCKTQINRCEDCSKKIYEKCNVCCIRDYRCEDCSKKINKCRDCNERIFRCMCGSYVCPNCLKNDEVYLKKARKFYYGRYLLGPFTCPFCLIDTDKNSSEERMKFLTNAKNSNLYEARKKTFLLIRREKYYNLETELDENMKLIKNNKKHLI